VSSRLSVASTSISASAVDGVHDLRRNKQADLVGAPYATQPKTEHVGERASRPEPQAVAATAPAFKIPFVNRGRPEGDVMLAEKEPPSAVRQFCRQPARCLEELDQLGFLPADPIEPGMTSSFSGVANTFAFRSRRFAFCKTRLRVRLFTSL
jgi:hypothetical protein